uniref:Uncharacterized protein n=1 Tax=Anguilla anguilla TaxID=7936 RepID=A0A0E9V023_ANGAN
MPAYLLSQTVMEMRFNCTQKLFAITVSPSTRDLEGMSEQTMLKQRKRNRPFCVYK